MQPQLEVWVVLTRDPGVYIVGELLQLNAESLRLVRPVLMTRKGSSVTFDRLDVVEGELLVPVANHPGFARLAKTYRTHYEKFLRLEDPSVT